MLGEVGLNSGSIKLDYWIYSASRKSKTNKFIYIKNFLSSKINKDPAINDEI